MSFRIYPDPYQDSWYRFRIPDGALQPGLNKTILTPRYTIKDYTAIEQWATDMADKYEPYDRHQ